MKTLECNSGCNLAQNKNAQRSSTVKIKILFFFSLSKRMLLVLIQILTGGNAEI